MTGIVILVAVLCYLIGSIPSGYLVARVKGIDIRRQGSGNIGATNVLRTLGVGPGLTVLALDVLKGVVSVYIGKHTGIPGVELLAGVCAVIGHAAPVFLCFKGGKIIATGGGAMLAMDPVITLIALLIFILVVILFRYISLASICAAVSLPVMTAAFHPQDLKFIGFAAFFAIMAIIRHISNIKRLLAGTEPKFQPGKKNS